MEAVQASPPPPSEALLTLLLNEITTVSDNFILVLDDYHVIDSHPVDEALTFLVEHQPPHLQLVIASREDPPLPLARLRVRGQLTELRAADLRFTPAEAAEFLNHSMGLNLSPDGILLFASFKLKQLLQMLWTSKIGNQQVICAMAPGSLEDLMAVKELAEAGKIKSIVERCYPLEQAADAHQYVESGHKQGNVAITLGHTDKT